MVALLPEEDVPRVALGTVDLERGDFAQAQAWKEGVVKQMTGEYRVKNEALKQLWREAAQLAGGFGRVEYRAVRRELNELADRLVNEALDAA